MSSADCLDCALFECDICAAQEPEYGCCCGRVAPTAVYDDYDEEDWF